MDRGDSQYLMGLEGVGMGQGQGDGQTPGQGPRDRPAELKVDWKPGFQAAAPH